MANMSSSSHMFGQHHSPWQIFQSMSWYYALDDKFTKHKSLYTLENEFTYSMTSCDGCNNIVVITL